MTGPIHDVRECAALREDAERRILEILQDLTRQTNLDLRDVAVIRIDGARESDGEPQARAVAVRIDLCV